MKIKLTSKKSTILETYMQIKFFMSTDHKLEGVR